MNQNARNWHSFRCGFEVAVVVSQPPSRNPPDKSLRRSTEPQTIRMVGNCKPSPGKPLKEEWVKYVNYDGDGNVMVVMVSKTLQTVLQFHLHGGRKEISGWRNGLHQKSRCFLTSDKDPAVLDKES